MRAGMFSHLQSCVRFVSFMAIIAVCAAQVCSSLLQMLLAMLAESNPGNGRLYTSTQDQAVIRLLELHVPKHLNVSHALPSMSCM